MSALLHVLFNPRFWLYLLSSPVRFMRLMVSGYLETTAQNSFPGVTFGKRVHLPLLELGKIRIGEGSNVLDDVTLIIDPLSEPVSDVCINIGRNCKIGRRTQIGSGGASKIVIGDFVRCHNNCVVLGNVHIHSYSILSANIFISSGDHHFRHAPEQLIINQDRLATHRLKNRVAPLNVIEEDVWVGWGVVIKSGITIGRGAVLGANSVVTRNVAPYSVVAGAPAKQVGTRLAFNPPAVLNPEEDSCLPYFYRGFVPSDMGRNSSAKRLFLSHRAECVLWVPKSVEVILELTNAYGGNLREVTIDGISVEWRVSPDEKRITISTYVEELVERECPFGPETGSALHLCWTTDEIRGHGIRMVTCTPTNA